MKRFLLAAWLAILLPIAALAQTPPQQPPYSVLGGQTTLSVTSSSSRVAFPSSTIAYGAITLFNKGTTDAYYALGGSTVVATTSSGCTVLVPISCLIPAGTSLTVWVGSGTYVAAITASATTSLVIYQGSGPLTFRTNGTGETPGGAAGGDLGGTYPNPIVLSVAHVTTGVLPASNGGAGTVSGALKGNGSGTVSQAACGDLSNGATGCSTPAYVLPVAAPTTIGGVFSKAAITHDFLTSINSADGSIGQAQPACGDLLDSGSGCSGSTANGANPSQAITGAVHNGSATTFMRSDAAPALGTITQQVIVNLNSASAPSSIAGAGLLISPADGVTGRAQVNGYGTISAFSGGRYDGTLVSPTAVQANDQITGINAYAYDGTTLDGPIASFRTYATDTITSAHWGSKACIATSATNTTTLADSLCQFQSGGINVGSPTGGDKGAGTLNATGLYVNNIAVLTSSGFPIVLGSTSIASGSTTTSVAGLSITAGGTNTLAASSLSLGGAIIGSDALGVTGTSTFNSGVTFGAAITYGGVTLSNAVTGTGNMVLSANSTLSGTTNATFLSLAGTGTLSWSGRGILSSPAAGSIQVGTSDVDTNAALVAQIFRPQGLAAGGTADQAGKDFSIYGSPSKGAAAGGSVKIFTTPAGSTGTAVNTETLALTIDSTGLATFAGNSSGITITATQNIVTTGGSIKGVNIIAANGAFFGFATIASYLTSPSAAVWQMGNNANGTPVSNTLKLGESGSGSNIAAGSGTILPGLSTGNATNPDLIFQTGVKTTSGSSVATATTAMTIKGETQQVQIGAGGLSVSGAVSLTSTVVNGGSANGWELTPASASSTVPSIIPNHSDTTTGIGAQASGNMSMIVGGVENTRFASGGFGEVGRSTIGSAMLATGQAGDLGMVPETDAAAAPGAGYCVMKWVAATVSGKKLIAYCDTSTTPVTVVDNVGN